MFALTGLLIHVIIAMLCNLMHSNAEKVGRETDIMEEYCNSELFQPQCLKNEAILMRSATYGRMRIGRCITAEEVDAQRSLAGGDDPRILGCSADVLSILDRKCSGKSQCDVRTAEISHSNVKPCLPGLIAYLEVSYDCITVADDDRSCAVALTVNPIHIIGSMAQKNCGTEFHPWTVEAPVGQQISITLFYFAASALDASERQGLTSRCISEGLIVDKTAKRNKTICAEEEQRTKEFYTSNGNAVDIILTVGRQKKHVHNDSIFLLQLQAIGCSDIIPPEDAWLKWRDGEVVIGCYSSRKTWHLQCKKGSWIGVIGNCSQQESPKGLQDLDVVSETGSTVSNDELVVTSVAIAGLTLALCMAIVCIGVICLRRVNVKGRKEQDYKTLNAQVNSSRNLILNQTLPSSVATDFHENGLNMQHVPTYSVYVGHSDADNSVA